MNTQDNEIDELIRKIQLRATGENSHTANKAVNYLMIAKKRPEGDVAREKFVEVVRSALACGNMAELKQYMAKWW